VPEGVITQPLAPAFSSSHALIRSSRGPSPSGGTPIRTRTGKRRSASAIMNPELAAIGVFRFCSPPNLAHPAPRVQIGENVFTLCGPHRVSQGGRSGPRSCRSRCGNRYRHRRSNMHRRERPQRKDGARGVEGAVAFWPVRYSRVAYGLSGTGPRLTSVLSPRVADRLPLEIGYSIGAATSEGDNVIFPIAGTGTARPAGRRAWMFPLELACNHA
jgi:hypothetical protein